MRPCMKYVWESEESVLVQQVVLLRYAHSHTLMSTSIKKKP